MDLNAGHESACEWRFEDIEQASSGDPDEHNLVPEDRRIDVRFLFRQKLLFRVEQVKK